jgi:NADPH:quinone reductase-like Zn-dependent oxidoreductase
MRKVVYNKYGSIDDLQMSEVEIPTIQADELLIKIKAVAINPLGLEKIGRSAKDNNW